MVGDTKRRDVLKAAGTAGAAGALGMLSGYAAEEDASDVDASDGVEDADGTDATRQESVTVSFWSGLAAENSALTEHFRSSMENFQQMNDGNIQVDLQPVSYGDIKSQLVSAVQAGNEPDLASSGTAGIQFFLDDLVGDHNSWVEETGIAEDWLNFNTESANFRGDWWAGGTVGANGTMLTVRPQFFKDVGVNDPSGLETWTDFTRALEQIGQQNPGLFPYEESGVWNDLESYWGQAQTSFVEGVDPWLRGDPENPQVLVGEEPRTDGMIKACVDRARTYSSPGSPQRTDEQMPALMLGDRVASNTTGFGNPQRWRSQNPDVTFGWDGDIWQGPIPKLDANYGNEFGYDDLADLEGQHGGATSGLESQNQVFDTDAEEQAFTLQEYLMTNEDHVVPVIGELYGNVAGYAPINEVVRNEYDLVQIQTAMIEALQEYEPKYRTVGAAWDIDATDAVRWDSLNRTISSGIAGQIEVEQVPARIREKILTALETGQVTTTAS